MARAKTVNASEVTDVTITTDAVKGLAARHAQLHPTLDVLKKWEWARDVSLLLERTADKKARTIASKTLGTLIGEGLGRGAYSGSWVLQHCAAYKKFETGLTNQEECRAFLLAVNGNSGPSKLASRGEKSVSATDKPKADEKDDVPVPHVRKPRRKKYARGKYPRPLTGDSKDVKLMRLPWKQVITIGEAAELMGICRKGLQSNYFHTQKYSLPDYIELLKDGSRIVGIRRIGP